jgi:ribosome assembly protein YihI (activator of Der GTPase)
LVDPFEPTPEPVDHGVQASSLQTIKSRLMKYQDQMRHQEEEMPYHSVLRQLIKLSQKPLHSVPLDAVDTLHRKDYDAISRLLDEIEALMKKLGIDNPSSSHWNDIGLREVRNHEKEFQLQISSFLATLYDIRSILLDLASNHGYLLPSDVNELSRDLEYTGYLTTSKYPSSWFEEGVFVGVEASLQEHSDIIVRYNALVHTLTGNYKKEALTEQLPERYQQMKDPHFCPSEEHLDYLISSRQDVLTTNQQLKRVWKDVVNSLEEFEVVYRTERGPGFIDFIRLNNKLLLDSTFDRKWLDVSLDKMQLLQQQMNLRKGAIDAYINESRAISIYAAPKILTIEPSILVKYKERLSKRFLLSADEKTATRLVEQYVTAQYQSLNVKEKETLMDRLLQLQALIKPLEDVTNLIQTTVKINVDPLLLHEYQAVVSMIVNNASQYSLQTMDQYRLNKLKILDGSFQQSMRELDRILSIQAFQSISYHNPVDAAENIRQLDQYFQQLYSSVDVFMKLQIQSGKRPTATTMQGLVGIIERIRATKNRVQELEPTMQHYYQSMYQSELTDFSALKQLRQEFSLLLQHFSDFNSMKQEYVKDQFLFIKDQIRVLHSDLKAYDKQRPIMVSYFNHQEFPTDVVDFIAYLEPFNQLTELQMWLDLSDNIQSLRGFKQSRIAAQINTGVYSRSLKRSFQNEYLKVLAKRFTTPTDVAAIKEDYKNFKEASIQQIKQYRYDVVRKIRKPRITMSNLQTLPLLDRKNYDVIIVNGVERLPEVLIGHLRGLAHQQIYIEDQLQPTMLGMINKPRQGMYPPINEVTYHQTQLRANLLTTKFDVAGVIHPASVTKVHSLPLAQSVVAKLKQTSGYVTVVIFRPEQRNLVLESIRSLILAEDPMIADMLLSHLRVAVDPEYVVTSDTLYLLWDRYVEADKITRYLSLATDIIIVNEDQTLEDAAIERYVQTPISYYNEIEDDVILWLVSRLPQEYTYKKAMKPYDIAVSKGEDVDALIHVMVYDEDQVDIVDQAILLHDRAYDPIPKLFIALHELYPTESVESISSSLKALL